MCVMSFTFGPKLTWNHWLTSSVFGIQLPREQWSLPHATLLFTCVDDAVILLSGIDSSFIPNGLEIQAVFVIVIWNEQLNMN